MVKADDPEATRADSDHRVRDPSEAYTHAADRVGWSGGLPLPLSSSAYCRARSVQLSRPSVTHVALSVSERFSSSTEWWTVASIAVEAGERMPGYTSAK
jgi:hypothetical protein